MHVKYEAIPAVTWEEYYRYSVKHSAINHSTNQSKNQSINQGSTFLVDEELEGGDDDLGIQKVELDKEGVHVPVVVGLRTLAPDNPEHPHPGPARLHDVGQQLLRPDVAAT